MRFLFLLVFCPFIFSAANAADQKSLVGLGIWSWSQSNFVTPEASAALLDFCSEERISHIDQHLSIAKTKKGYELKNGEELKRLLQDANARKISINALRGEGPMFFKENHDRTLAQLKIIIRFNNTLPKDARFAGIKYDVEPYLTPQWRAGGNSRMKVISDYLDFLDKAKALIAEQTETFDLCVDIPFWWDKTEFSSMRNEKDKRFIHHIIDVTDWIGIMSYRTEADEIIRLTKEEFDYAKQLNKPHAVAPGVNTAAEKGEESWTSFDGIPPEKFRKEIAELQNYFSGNKAARLIMIHDYKGLVKYLKAE